MKHYFIMNPAAGKGKRFQDVIDSIHKVCSERGVDYEVHITEKAGGATEFVRKICESTTEQVRFYACGGDGTVNEVARGLIGADNAELGVFPMGTGNDLVRSFENKENFLDIEAQLDGEAKKIDVIRYNDKYSINMMNAGFDCEVAKQAIKNRRNAFVPSKVAFILGVVQKFFSMPTVKGKLYVDGALHEWHEFQLCAVGNGSFYGGGFCAAPISVLNDGVLDLCLVSPVSRLRFLTLVGSYKAGTHLEKVKDPRVLNYCKCEKIEVVFDAPTEVSIDGEIETVESLVITTEREAISFCIPRGSAMRGEKAEEKQKVNV